MTNNSLTIRYQMPKKGLNLTPDLPGFMRQSSVGNHHQSPDTHTRSRSIDISYADDSVSTINNGEGEEDDEDIIISSFFIPGITGAARCLEGKSRFDATVGKVPSARRTCGSTKEEIKSPREDVYNRTYGLESIHHEHLTQSVDSVRSLLQRSKYKNEHSSRSGISM